MVSVFPGTGTQWGERMTDSGKTDAQLLEAWVRNHCEPSFRELVGRYAGLVHQAAYRRTGDESLAHDAAQATFITLARKAKALTGRESLAGWLHVTAVNLSKNLLRSQMREIRKRQRLMGEHPGAEPSGHDAWRQMKPELDDAMAELSAPDREALLLRYYRALGVAEIATVLGISTEAAQKRVTRATERLRNRLSARGCVLPGAGCVAALAFLAEDAKAGSALAGSFASKAILVPATAAPFTALGTALLVSKKSSLVAAASALVLSAGVGAYVIHERTKPEPSGIMEVHAGAGGGSFPATGAGPEDRAARARAVAASPELAGKYGESRTNLSRHVVQGFLDLLDELMSLAEQAESADAGAFRLELNKDLGDLPEKLSLTDDQREAAGKILAERRAGQVEEIRKLADHLKRNPSGLMEIVLAGDALVRNRISREDYDAIVARSGESIERVAANVIDGKLSDVEDPLLRDPACRQRFIGILDPTQQETFRGLSAETPETGETPETAVAVETSEVLQPMELEKLEQTLTSSRQMISGVRQMLEGIRHLQPSGTQTGEGR